MVSLIVEPSRPWIRSSGSATIAVFPPFTVNATCAAQCVVGYQCRTCGRFGTQSGGAGPYTYKVVGGGIPPGMSLSGLALAGPFPAPATINVPVDTVGPPRSTALWTLSVQATDAFGVSRTVAANFVEFGPLAMDCSNGQVCASCTQATCSPGSGNITNGHSEILFNYLGIMS